MDSEVPDSDTVPRRSTISSQIRRARARALVAEGTPPLKKPRGRRERRDAEIDPTSFERALGEWRGWFDEKGWTVFPFQDAVWTAFGRGESGLLLSATGSGKTYAALGGPLSAARAGGVGGSHDRLRVIYLSPLKALVRNLEKALLAPIADLGWDLRVETRTGDTSVADRRRQREKPPHVLLTTPESLALLLTDPGWRERVAELEAVVIDEWHELLGSKRGSLLELSLARLRSAAPRLRTWAVSATVSDPILAARVATGNEDPVIVRGESGRKVEVDVLPPRTENDLPWFGHGGVRRVPEVADELDPAITTLIFTNTRSQAERWFAALLAHRPEWEGRIALHHGSLDREERERVENAVKDGSLSFVVATSSLDLGVDFPTVEKVIQIGSVKGVSRAVQRAGRAFHRPGESTRLTVCPTHFLEYVEVAALRRAIAGNEVEPRFPREAPRDVLVQHVLSSALGEGFRAADLLTEIRSAWSFRNLSDAEFAWVLRFIVTGGETLRAYPQFQKVIEDVDARFRFATPRLARYHRMNIGTIVGETGVRVRFLRGATLGQIGEEFMTKLKRGDAFRFAGKTLELVRFHDLTAYVRIARKKESVATVWGGQSLPISEGLSRHIRDLLSEVADGRLDRAPAELAALQATFGVQRRRSAIPSRGETLVERIDTREGFHLFVFTWEGRAVNEGLGHLLAYRLSRKSPNTIAVSANDHGFECLGTVAFPPDDEIRGAFGDLESLEIDIEASLNYPEMAKRAFREVARVSGLIQVGPPNERKSVRHLQMSASLLFDVFRAYDPTHPLLLEAFREVRRTQLELERLRRVLTEIGGGKILVQAPSALTPFAFPLFVERIRSRLSTEALADRIARMQAKVFAP